MIAAWLVHLYTASGAVLGFLAAADITTSHYQRAFYYLFGAVIVDATDGVLARTARVKEVLPGFDGALLDNIVDYVTYVFVPALFIWHALIVPDEYSIWIAAAMLLSSAYGFSRADAKTGDHLFTGFPSYWNVVALYLHVAGWPQMVNVAILLALSVLVFIPIRYVYPSRTGILRPLTIALTLLWGAMLLVLLVRGHRAPRPLLWASLLYPAYYFVLSLALTARRRIAHAA